MQCREKLDAVDSLDVVHAVADHLQQCVQDLPGSVLERDFRQNLI